MTRLADSAYPHRLPAFFCHSCSLAKEQSFPPESCTAPIATRSGGCCIPGRPLPSLCSHSRYQFVHTDRISHMNIKLYSVVDVSIDKSAYRFTVMMLQSKPHSPYLIDRFHQCGSYLCIKQLDKADRFINWRLCEL